MECTASKAALHAYAPGVVERDAITDTGECVAISSDRPISPREINDGGAVLAADDSIHVNGMELNVDGCTTAV